MSAAGPAEREKRSSQISGDDINGGRKEKMEVRVEK